MKLTENWITFYVLLALVLSYTWDQFWHMMLGDTLPALLLAACGYIAACVVGCWSLFAGEAKSN